MPDPLPPHVWEAAKPSLHPALYGTEGLPSAVPTILLCPLPLPGFHHEQLLPELSHELKTPLTGIMGLAQVLQRDTAPMADREHLYADLIYQRSQQLLLSINDLFDLAQLCTHQFVLQLRPIDLASVMKTALQVAQHTTPSNLPWIEAAHPHLENIELWMMGDLRRVEQLLTHLIGYFAVQSLPESHPKMTLRSHHSWLSITLMGRLQFDSALGPGHLSEPYPGLNAWVSNLPGRSGTFLKFLLAQQLAQLHGGDVSWRAQASLETEVTVLLPRDLTRATFFKRSGPAQPLFVIYAPQLAQVDDLAQMLHQQDVLAVIARSLHEVQEKARILSPSVLILDGDCVKTLEWSALEALLAERSTCNPIQIVWLGTRPFPTDKEPIQTLDIWSMPLISDQVAQTLQQLQQNAKQLSSKAPAQAVVASHIPQCPRPFIVLQIGQISLSPPETMFVAIMTHLSRDFGCSVLVVDDLEHAELLAEIWQPQVMICSGTLPAWAVHVPQSSVLAQLPLFLLDIEGHKVPQCYSSNHCSVYPVARNASIQDSAQTLYEALSAAAQGNPLKRKD
jgi:His Kinase A (phospho-acceptor) domain